MLQNKQIKTETKTPKKGREEESKKGSPGRKEGKERKEQRKKARWKKEKTRVNQKYHADTGGGGLAHTDRTTRDNAVGDRSGIER